MNNVRLLPVVIVTLGAVLSLKAVAVAEEQASAVAQPAGENGGGSGGSGGVGAAEKPAAGAPIAPAKPAAANAAPSQACPPGGIASQAGLSPSEVQVLQSLGERRKALDARAQQLDTREQLLAAGERRINERIEELKRLEARLNAQLGQVDAQQEARLKSLVDVYQRMRAKDAAEVFNGLPDDVLFQVASRMRQANLAEIMGIMLPERARKLTTMLAANPLPPQAPPGQNLSRSTNVSPPAPPPAAPPASTNR